MRDHHESRADRAIPLLAEAIRLAAAAAEEAAGRSGCPGGLKLARRAKALARQVEEMYPRGEVQR